MASIPPIHIPVIAGKEKLELVLHEMFESDEGGCTHIPGKYSDYKPCEIIAQRLFDMEAVQEPEDFISSLGDNPAVQKVLKNVMKTAWHEGNMARYGGECPYE